MSGGLGDALEVIGPLLVAAAIGYLFAVGVEIRREGGRLQVQAQRSALQALREWRRAVAIVLDRKEIGKGATSDDAKPHDALCTLLDHLLDESAAFPSWKRRLLLRHLVAFAGVEPLVVERIGCPSEGVADQRDFWLRVFNEFTLLDEFVGTVAWPWLMHRAARFNTPDQWSDLLREAEDIAAVVRVPRWNLVARWRLRVKLPRQLRSHIIALS